MAADLDQAVAEFRHRPLDTAGPFTFVAAVALTMKVREGGRVVNAVVLLATGVNGDGHREVLGMRVATSETGAAWNEFFADLVARGLGGVRLVTSDAHAGLREAIAANLPGATRQRCRTHYAANPMSICPKSMWPAVKAMLHPFKSVYDQPDATAVHASSTGSSTTSARGSPRSPSISPPPVRTSWPSPRSPRTSGPRSGPTTPPNASRDPPPHRRRRDLPQPRRDRPPHRRRPGRADRRMGRRPPLPRPGNPHPLPPHPHPRRTQDRSRRPTRTHRLRTEEGSRSGATPPHGT
jgi:hypothetical protein